VKNLETRTRRSIAQAKAFADTSKN